MVKLTQYSHGAGCGCKIAPKVLDEILKTSLPVKNDPRLIVGNEGRDDAAVYDTGNGQAIISTTDFFMPITDDAFDFGRIAAANAISDVYAMGGKPLMAVAILGWPVDKLPVELAQQVLDGGRQICNEAGIPLAGGHSIDSPEPIFGLAVTGTIDLKNLKKNNTAGIGDEIYITKPLGVGVLSTAQKRELLDEDGHQEMIKHMTRLNKAGELLGKIPGVTAMTDITGFGFLGHLIEMTSGSSCSAEINYDMVPVAKGVKELIAKRIFPDATTRNWSSYGTEVAFEKGVNVMEAFTLLPDPQTNGGLLFTAKPGSLEEIQTVLKKAGDDTELFAIGRMVPKKEKLIIIHP